jgi:hypothetical protein
MAKITKRAMDALQSVKGRDVFIWDGELRGFGVRVKPSGVRTFLIQYRNVEWRTRRLVLGQYGALTLENARDLAREKLAGVAKGEDPSAERHAVRAGMSVSEVCDWYLEEAEARGVTQGYVHLDTALIVAADRVSAEIAKLLDGMSDTRKSRKSLAKTLMTKVAA